MIKLTRGIIIKRLNSYNLCFCASFGQEILKFFWLVPSENWVWKWWTNTSLPPELGVGYTFTWTEMLLFYKVIPSVLFLLNMLFLNVFEYFWCSNVLIKMIGTEDKYYLLSHLTTEFQNSLSLYEYVAYSYWASNIISSLKCRAGGLYSCTEMWAKFSLHLCAN